MARSAAAALDARAPAPAADAELANRENETSDDDSGDPR
jgi:hypothetical protein